MADELVLYDSIGEEQSTARYVLEFLRAAEGDLIVAINSGGGDVFEAEAIFNSLRRYDQTKGMVTTRIDALAASAASYIALAGRQVVMAPGAMIMVHSPLAFTYGNREHLRDIIDRLEKVEASMVRVYAKKSGQDEAKIKEMLAAETWLTAEEALEVGFIDRIDKSLELAASVYGNFSQYRHVPVQIAAIAKYKLTPDQQAALARQNIALAKVQGNKEKEVEKPEPEVLVASVPPVVETKAEVEQDEPVVDTKTPERNKRVRSRASAAAMRLRAQAWRQRLAQPA